MRIRMITTAAGPKGVWPAGSVQVVDAAQAGVLIEHGYAVYVDGGPSTSSGDGGVARETADAPPVVEVADAPAALRQAQPAQRKPRRRKAPVKVKDSK